MAIRPAVLILALALAPGAAPAAPAERPVCGGCHEPHLAALGACTDCHRGNPSTSRASIAHDRLLRGDAAAWSMPGSPAVAEGGRLIGALGCRRCHGTGGSGNALAIALDRVAWRRRQEDLRRSIRQPASLMPDFALTEAAADKLIAAILHDADPLGAEGRYLVRFRPEGTARPNAFRKNCGPCHRALTARGPMGEGATGPNLSGLLTPYYPVPDGRAWDRGRLARWIANPRAERPGTLMRPVSLSATELDEVAWLLAPGAGPAVSAGAHASRTRESCGAAVRARHVSGETIR